MNTSARLKFYGTVAFSIMTVVAVATAIGSTRTGNSAGTALTNIAKSVTLIAAPTQPERFAGVGAVISPVTADATPALSEVAALSTLNTANFALSLKGTKSPSFISLVMYENQFGQMNAGQPDTPSVPSQLAWFAEYDNVPSTRSLPLNHPIGQSSNVICKVYVAISAASGDSLDGFSVCTPA